MPSIKPEPVRRHKDAPVDVFITVDTEVWPCAPDWRATHLAEDVERCLYGPTGKGELGVRHQLDLMDAHGMKAVFFVEPLFSRVAGMDPLRRLVSLISSRGHDTQLHVHSEWLAWLEPELLPGRRGQNLRDFSATEQETLLRAGKQALEDAGAQPLLAFRAGNFGANRDTLRALKAVGIGIDSSYNPAAPKEACAIDPPLPFWQPGEIEGVIEYPISVFEDWPGHFRPAQICAISSAEMEHALDSAWHAGWTSFVIVTHSFELLRPLRPAAAAQPCELVVKRMENLCRFMQKNKDRFRSATFAKPMPAPPPHQQTALSGSVWRTALRMREQIQERIVR